MHDSIRKMYLDLVWKGIINTKDIILSAILFPAYVVLFASMAIVYSFDYLLGSVGQKMVSRYRQAMMAIARVLDI